MIKKLNFYANKAYINALNKLDSLFDEEDGMETVETVILIVVAVIIAGGVLAMIGKNKDEGLLKVIYDKITAKFEEMFS